MGKSMILESQPCQWLLSKISNLLEKKFSTSLHEFLEKCRFGGETGLLELGLGNCLLLLLLQGLAHGDVFLIVVLSELAHRFQPLESSHFIEWLNEDYRIDQDVWRKALDQALWLNRTGVISIPDSVIKILSGLMEKAGAELSERTSLQAMSCQNQLPVQRKEDLPLVAPQTEPLNEPTPQLEEVSLVVSQAEFSDKPTPQLEEVSLVAPHAEFSDEPTPPQEVCTFWYFIL